MSKQIPVKGPNTYMAADRAEQELPFVHDAHVRDRTLGLLECSTKETLPFADRDTHVEALYTPVACAGEYQVLRNWSVRNNTSFTHTHWLLVNRQDVTLCVYDLKSPRVHVRLKDSSPTSA